MQSGDMQLTKDQIYSLLSEIPDPEIPVITIEELGVLRGVELTPGGCEVTITPTYTGCPAMQMIEDEIRSTLHKHGVDLVNIKMTYSPAWTTDWISNDAKFKLKQYGIAPPELLSVDKLTLLGGTRHIQCPQCNSINTEMISQFGSTACKSLYRCNDCREPFDYFKCH